MLSHDLMNILACPVCKGGLKTDNDEQRLICYPCRLAFPIRDGIPVMLVDEADTITDPLAADSTP